MPPKRKSSWVIVVLLMLMLTASNGDPSTTKSGTSSLSVVDSMVGLLWRPLVQYIHSSRRLGGLGLTYILYQGPTPTPIMLTEPSHELQSLRRIGRASSLRYITTVYTTRDQSFRAYPFLNGTPHTLTLIPRQLSAHERFGDYGRVAVGIDYHILLYGQLLRSL